MRNTGCDKILFRKGLTAKREKKETIAEGARSVCLSVER